MTASDTTDKANGISTADPASLLTLSADTTIFRFPFYSADLQLQHKKQESQVTFQHQDSRRGVGLLFYCVSYDMHIHTGVVIVNIKGHL